MIISETYISPTAEQPLIRIYSDQGYFIQSGDLIYQDAIIVNEEQINNFYETTTPIPAPTASMEFIYQTFFTNNRNVTKEEIILAQKLILKSFRNLTDEEAYSVKFFFKQWDEEKQYEIGDRVFYNNELYTVIKKPFNTLSPADNFECFKLTGKPAEYIDEWNELIPKNYKIGERVKIGTHIYESLVNNNIWSPIDLPSAWQLIS